MARVQRTTILRSSYHDSLTLMRLSLELEGLEGVERVAVFMGFADNLQLLDEAGFPPPAEPVTGNDLLLAVMADTTETLEKAFLEARRLLKGQAPVISAQVRPRSLRAAMFRSLRPTPQPSGFQSRASSSTSTSSSTSPAWSAQLTCQRSRPGWWTASARRTPSGSHRAR